MNIFLYKNVKCLSLITRADEVTFDVVPNNFLKQYLEITILNKSW